MKGAGSFLWLILLAVLVFVAQRMPPLERIYDPAAIPDAPRRIFGWGVPEPLFSPGGEAAPKAEVTSGCSACRGTERIECPLCQGRGQVDRVSSTPCSQCRGTGVYRSRVSSRSGAPCAFCRGTGKVETRQKVTCTRCTGAGTIPCPACQRAASSPGTE